MNHNNTYRVIETDNHGGDYPNEKWICPPTTFQLARNIAKAFNEAFCTTNEDPRYYGVVPSDYVLQPGFEP